MKLEDLKPGVLVRGISPDGPVTVVAITPYGPDALDLTYKESNGRVGSCVLYRSDESRLEVVEVGLPWSFDGDGALFRLVSEAHRIRLAYLFDPLLAVHTSLLDPLPHQVTAVYEEMLPRQPLRFLLADDPGAGKTIMAGLLMKELMARGDVQRCLVVCPGNLVEQWQEELERRFQLRFEIMTNDKLRSAGSGNWFLEANLIIARMDQCARNEDVLHMLDTTECAFDLVVVDEAHKMSATFFGGEVRQTKRYRLGKLLSRRTRHFLLLTATPHNGKEEDFQLFLALLDPDRFEGRFRHGVERPDVSDLMRRMVKEKIVKVDGRPLFPERIAYTVPYSLSEDEARLYREVTEYVREEFNRAERILDNKRASAVGFALMVLQRRLASSPEAIYQSLRRRRERLEGELEKLQREKIETVVVDVVLDPDDIEDLEDAPEAELVRREEEICDRATASLTAAELFAEILTLRRLEKLADEVRRSGEDRKWNELAGLLREIFTPAALAGTVSEPTGGHIVPQSVASPRQKLVVFTEHRDTLNYLAQRVSALFGRPSAVITIHGGMEGRERRKAQDAFLYDPEVRVLVATDAAGEGINLQRAHLMVNYDLPWNPNRIEQRFGRIHRIGQTEVCHLWNLVAADTREGRVYRTLLDKLALARERLGGQVFDVLGKLQFAGRPLRDLLVEAIRYGEQPEVRERLTLAIAEAVDVSKLQTLVEEHALVHEVLDDARLVRIREDMERAEARRLQPHYVESFFLEAFRALGGVVRECEPGRYEVTNVPFKLRLRDRSSASRGPIQKRYERISFHKDQISATAHPPVTFVCPGHPLLDGVIDFTLEKHRELLSRGSVLVDELDHGAEPRVLFYVEHAIQDASTGQGEERRTISRRMFFVEVDRNGEVRHSDYPPYLDYRPLRPNEPAIETILARLECSWIDHQLEQRVIAYTVQAVIPEHLEQVRKRRLERIEKTRAAVEDRLSTEISHWTHRAQELKLQEQAGKPNARLNSEEARRRAEELALRLEKRRKLLAREGQISPLPPVVVGGAVVVPLGLLSKLTGVPTSASGVNTRAMLARARAVVMAVERRLGFEPRESDRRGYDIESRDPASGGLRFLSVKSCMAGGEPIAVTKNEVFTSLNKPDTYFLAIVEFLDAERHKVHYVRGPLNAASDFQSANAWIEWDELKSRAELVG